MPPSCLAEVPTRRGHFSNKYGGNVLSRVPSATDSVPGPRAGVPLWLQSTVGGSENKEEEEAVVMLWPRD